MFNRVKTISFIKQMPPIIYALLIFILLYFIFNNFKKSDDLKKLHTRIVESKKSEAIKKISDNDTDGDGLKDWQEILYKTDIDVVDTDGDGKSDYEEIILGWDPLSFGEGGIDSKVKIVEAKKVLSSVEEQKKDFQEYKELLGIQEKKRFELYLKKQKKEITKEDRLLLQKIKNDRKKFTNDLNDMGKVMVLKGSGIYIFDEKIFNKLFSIKSGSPKDQKMSQSDIYYIREKIKLMGDVSRDLNNLKLSSIEIKKFRDDLSKAYKMMSENLSIILESDEKIKTSVFENYIKGTLLQTKTKKYINYFIVEKKLNISRYGSYFEFKL